MVAILLAVSLCSTMVQPVDRTDEAWIAALNRTLHACFDELEPAIGNATVGIGEPPVLANTKCDESHVCTVLIGRNALAELSPDELIFLIGHEAAHVKLLKDEYQFIGPIEVEFVADLLAVDAQASGACYGARALQWIVDQIPNDPETTTQRNLVAQRRVALLAQCAADIARLGQK